MGQALAAKADLSAALRERDDKIKLYRKHIEDSLVELGCELPPQENYEMNLLQTMKTCITSAANDRNDLESLVETMKCTAEETMGACLQRYVDTMDKDQETDAVVEETGTAEVEAAAQRVRRRRTRQNVDKKTMMKLENDDRINNRFKKAAGCGEDVTMQPVSYTHLTLPTILPV